MNILFPGSFSPLHDGHKYIYDKIKLLFPYATIHMTSFQNPDKPINNSSFPVYTGTIDEYCHSHNIDLIVRGMRTYLDPLEDTKWLDYVLTATSCTIIYIKSSKDLETLSSKSLTST